MTAYLNALGVICSLGRGPDDVARSLFAGDCSGTVGAVKGELAAIPAELHQQKSRNNQLLLEAALQIRDDIDHAIERYGRERIAVVLGTSTSGIDEASRGIAHYLQEQQFRPTNMTT